MRDWKKWAKAAGIRAIKTVAQTFVGIIGAVVTMEEVNWQMVISASILSGIVSMATSVAGLPELQESKEV